MLDNTQLQTGLVCLFCDIMARLFTSGISQEYALPERLKLLTDFAAVYYGDPELLVDEIELTEKRGWNSIH